MGPRRLRRAPAAACFSPGNTMEYQSPGPKFRARGGTRLCRENDPTEIGMKKGRSARLWPCKTYGCAAVVPGGTSRGRDTARDRGRLVMEPPDGWLAQAALPTARS